MSIAAKHLCFAPEHGSSELFTHVVHFLHDTIPTKQLVACRRVKQLVLFCFV